MEIISPFLRRIVKKSVKFFDLFKKKKSFLICKENSETF